MILIHKGKVKEAEDKIRELEGGNISSLEQKLPEEATVIFKKSFEILFFKKSL